MQRGLRPLKNLKFFTGLENYEESNAVPEDKFYNTQNVRFDTKVVSSKKGYQALGNLLTGGTKWQGISQYAYVLNNITTKKLIGIYNKIFREFNVGTQTWDTIPTSWTNVEDSYTDMIQYNNVLYAVNSMTAASPGVGKITNSTFAVVPSSPRGNAIESWVERLWVIGDPTSPNGVIASRAATLANPNYVEDWVTDTKVELVGKGGRCTAIRVLNNSLYVWKEDSIYFNTIDRFANGDTQFTELSRTGGAINQKSTIVVENDIWFLTPTLEVRSLGTERNLGTDPRTKNITEIIKRTVNLLDPVQDNPVMSYNNRVLKLSLKSKASPTNNLTFIFDYNTGGWGLDRGQAINVNTIWQSNRVYGEDASGQVFQDDTGYTANGATFTIYANTPFMDDNRPDTFKRARYIYVRGQQSYYQSLIIRLFRGNYNTYSDYTIASPFSLGVALGNVVNDGTWGSAEWGQSPWGGTPSDTGDDIPMYRFEELISVDRTANMFAVGILADINGGKVMLEQIILKIIDQNENYKRSDI